MICGALPMVDISTIRFIEVTITSSRLNVLLLEALQSAAYRRWLYFFAAPSSVPGRSIDDDDVGALVMLYSTKPCIQINRFFKCIDALQLGLLPDSAAHHHTHIIILPYRSTLFTFTDIPSN